MSLVCESKRWWEGNQVLKAQERFKNRPSRLASFDGKPPYWSSEATARCNNRSVDPSGIANDQYSSKWLTYPVNMQLAGCRGRRWWTDESTSEYSCLSRQSLGLGSSQLSAQLLSSQGVLIMTLHVPDRTKPLLCLCGRSLLIRAVQASQRSSHQAEASCIKLFRRRHRYSPVTL